MNCGGLFCRYMKLIYFCPEMKQNQEEAAENNRTLKRNLIIITVLYDAELLFKSVTVISAAVLSARSVYNVR